MAQTYFSRPVSYGLSEYKNKYNMSSSSLYNTNKKFSNVQSSGYGRVPSATRSRSYSTDRVPSAKYTPKGNVHELTKDYNAKVFGSSGTKYMNGGSSGVSTRSPLGYQGGSSSPASIYNTSNSSYGATLGRPGSGRRLPPGPGPFDERGRKIAVSDAISQAQKRTGPVKATYYPSSIPHRKDAELARDYDRLSLNEKSMVNDKSSSNSLIKSRKYGSTSSLKSTSTDRISLHEETYPISSKKGTTTTKHFNLNKHEPLPDINGDSHNDKSEGRDRNHNHNSDTYTSRRQKSRTQKEEEDDDDDEDDDPWEGRSSRGKNHSTKVKVNQNENQGLSGLSNLGNTCFMNTMLQCLSNICPILEYFTSNSYKKELNTSISKMHGELAEAFSSLLCEMWTTTKSRSSYYSSCVRPSRFKQLMGQLNSRFRNSDQHDAQEFLILFLEGLSADVNRVTKKRKKVPLEDKWDKASAEEKARATWRWYLSYEDSYLMDVFVGQMKSTLTCSQCHRESHTFDCFWDISLPVKRAYRTAINLEDCIKNFFQRETLNGVHCDHCKRHVTSEKHLSLWRYPRILILQLKRFEPSGLKVNTNVDYPLKDLDLSTYVSNSQGSSSPFYNLIGVACHSGTPSFGHYIAYARHPYSKQWHKYDDTTVTEVRSQQCVTSSAYVLFYERSDSHTASRL